MRPFPYRVFACLGCLLAVCLTRGWVSAASVKSDSRVKVSVKKALSAADKAETVLITLAIDKGWHIYANPVGLDDLAPSQTVVNIDGKPKPEIKLEYPAGKPAKDVLGDYRIYEDEVTIKARVRRGADSGPLTVAVKFQACNDKSCLQAATVKMTLP